MKISSVRRHHVEISGWVQFTGESKDREIVKLEVRLGAIDTSAHIDMTGDEMVEWCKSHNHRYTDLRNEH